MSGGTLNPDITIVGGGTGTGSVGPNAPRIVSISQASGVVVVGVVPNGVTGSFPVSQFQLFRGPTSGGPWTAFQAQDLSTTAIENFLFDQSPAFGVLEYYTAIAIDTQGNESADATPVPFVAFNVANPTAPNIQVSSYGPYPLLGQDVFLHPETGEGMIGPNGDLMVVNGLECLAQDIRIHLLTERGELLLHQDWGFGRGKIIGAGQAKRDVQAQILRADVIDVLNSEPRVAEVLAVDISVYDQFSWLIGYEIMAIGVEDPQRLNLVYPFMKQ